MKPVKLFYSYSHKDEELRAELGRHLSVLRRGGLIDEWHDRMIGAGDDWKSQIDRALLTAEIVLFLVSADFIASDYCWGEEMTKALERNERGEAKVIPVILRHCRWSATPLAKLQVVPSDARPVTAWSDRDEALDDVVAAIECIIRQMQGAAKVEPSIAIRAKSARKPPSQRKPKTSVSKVMEIPIVEDKFGYHYARVEDANLLRNASFVLAVRADVPMERLRRSFPQQLTIAAPNEIATIVRTRVDGIKVTACKYPPPQIPFHTGFCYFELESSSNYWKGLTDAVGIGLHLTGEFPGLSMSFWAILE